MVVAYSLGFNARERSLFGCFEQVLRPHQADLGLGIDKGYTNAKQAVNLPSMQTAFKRYP
jgi:hypothetical protein